jgi:predicted AlkP superfamily phosphohydrolase/phosphomutase
VRSLGRNSLGAVALGLVLGLLVVAGAAAEGKRKVIVLGFDGLDYGMMQDLMEAGRLPNLSRMAREGMFAPLGTAVPPQSPVAWSNFITGMDAGGHGIFDFIHRDPNTMIPFLSTSQTHASEKSLKLGKWQIPLAGGEVELLRKGKAFWQTLEENGVETTIMRMPANFPPSGTATRELSGMGTPDILGTYGTFSFYTTDPDEFSGRQVSGGHIYAVSVEDNAVHSSLYGPDNPFRVEKEKVSADFAFYLDPEMPFGKLVVGDEECLLAVGEWTEWVPVRFDLVPTQSLDGIARFYLKEMRPEFKLYVSPINMDPFNPALPISTPPSFAAELAKATGRFYTQGMPEDTKALSEGVLTTDEFLAQAKIAGDEILDQYDWVLDQFDEGLLFYYTGNQDQVGHMVWRDMDPEHPAYDPAIHAQYADVIPKIIERFDEIVGYTMDRMDENTTLVVMSDHGFASWRRALNLNTWLWKEGYLALKNPNIERDPGFFLNVDWRRTRVYGLGLNGLYVNLRGREKWGIVDPKDRRGLLEDVAAKLVKIVDPETGRRVVTKAYLSEDAYHDRGYLEIGPDMIVGYAKQYRCSNQSALGEMPAETFMDNTDEWSGDHCMDHETVPGVLYALPPLRKPAPTLRTLAAAILAEFGVGGFSGDATEGLRAIGYIAAEN